MAVNLKSWEPQQRATAAGVAIIAVLGVLAAYAEAVLGHTKTGVALALILTIGPPLLYAAIVRPIVFPFALYAILTPFDTLLVFSQLGTMSKILGLASGAAILFYMLRTKRFGEPPRSAALWILYYLWATASAGWAIDEPSSLQILQISWALLGLFLIMTMFRIDLRRLNIAAWAVFGGGLAAALYGLYYFHQSGTELGALGNRLWIQSDTSQINPDHFGNALLLPIALALIATLWSRTLTARLFTGASLLTMLAALVLTGSRGATLGLLAIVVFLLVRDRHRIQLLALSAAGLIGVLALTGGSLLQRFSESVTTGGAGRVSIWQAGWLAFKDNWFWGAGYGNFPFAYDRVYIHVFQLLNAQWHRAPHNIILGSAVELGIVGLGLLLAAWIGTFKLLSPIDETDARYPIKLAVQAAIIGLFVAGMFADIMITKYVWLAFILAALTYNAAPERSRVPIYTAEAESPARA